MPFFLFFFCFLVRPLLLRHAVGDNIAGNDFRLFFINYIVPRIVLLLRDGLVFGEQ